MTSLEADVVIIGSGIAGAMTAWKLASKGVKVAVLEAGPRIERADIVKKFTQSHKFDFSSGFPNEAWAPRPDWEDSKNPYIEHIGPDKVDIEYLRAVGGTTWHWSGSCSRLLPNDMRLRSAYGKGIDWPFDYAVLEPFYCEAEKEMGVAGDDKAHGGGPRSQPFPLPPVPLSYSDKIMAKGFAKLGLPLISVPVARNSKAYDGRSQCMGFGTCSPICPSGAQYAAIVHVKKAEALGVTVLDNTRVDRIIPGGDGKIDYILARKPDGAEVTARGKIFVVAANGIESPRLLLMSANENFPKGLGNSSGMVGRNFFEHPGVVCRIQLPQKVYPRGPEDTAASPAFRDGAFRKNRAAWDLGIHNRAYVHEVANELLQQGLEPPDLDKAIRDRVLRQLELNTLMDQLPDPQNGLTLDWSRKDRAGQPLMQLRYSYGDYERASFEESKKVFKRLAKALGADIVSVTGPWAHHHPFGMAMMGKDRASSVVDAFGRSHDHANLFIAGTATFPSGGTVSPSLTIAALALRMSGEIERQLRA